MSLPLYTPGYSWRTLAHERGKPIEQANRGQFDELVIDQWFHLEQMDRESYWMFVAGLHINVRCRRNGAVDLSVVDEDRGAGAGLSGPGEIRVAKRLPHGLPWWGKR